MLTGTVALLASEQRYSGFPRYCPNSNCRRGRFTGSVRSVTCNRHALSEIAGEALTGLQTTQSPQVWGVHEMRRCGIRDAENYSAEIFAELRPIGKVERRNSPPKRRR